MHLLDRQKKKNIEPFFRLSSRDQDPSLLPFLPSFPGWHLYSFKKAERKSPPALHIFFPREREKRKKRSGRLNPFYLDLIFSSSLFLCQVTDREDIGLRSFSPCPPARSLTQICRVYASFPPFVGATNSRRVFVARLSSPA